MLTRRRLLELTAAAGVSAFAPALRAAEGKTINDVTQLNPVTVADERKPRSADELRAALRAWPGSISVGGGRYSMGGQIAAVGSLHLDTRAMNQVVSFDAARHSTRVQAGMIWRDLQDVIDPRDLSVKIMQSYANFTVGGSVSVNVHGRYVGQGPLINAVQALQLVTANGDVLELSRTREPELFRAVAGGYGGLGVITEVELALDANSRIERVVENVALEHYPAFFRDKILTNKKMVLHNADLTPPNFAAPRAISWVTSGNPLTEKARLVPRGLNYKLEKNAIWALTELPGGSHLRENVIDRKLPRRPAVTWRNYEASQDAASLEPRSRRLSTYVLQEYFVPVENFVPFTQRMAGILKTHQVTALNVSIRHSPADKLSLMAWAPAEVFTFVLYYKQGTQSSASDAVGLWTRKLIDAALELGGRYYLPYRLHATREQFERAYPQARAFAALKTRVDPGNRLRNQLWDKYLPTR